MPWCYTKAALSSVYCAEEGQRSGRSLCHLTPNSIEAALSIAEDAVPGIQLLTR